MTRKALINFKLMLIFLRNNANKSFTKCPIPTLHYTVTCNMLAAKGGGGGTESQEGEEEANCVSCGTAILKADRETPGDEVKLS